MKSQTTKLDGGVIAGIVIAVVAFVAAIIALTVCCVCRRRAKRKNNKSKNGKSGTPSQDESEFAFGEATTVNLNGHQPMCLWPWTKPQNQKHHRRKLNHAPSTQSKDDTIKPRRNDVYEYDGPDTLIDDAKNPDKAPPVPARRVQQAPQQRKPVQNSQVVEQDRLKLSNNENTSPYKPLCNNGTPSRSAAQKTSAEKCFKTEIREFCRTIESNNEMDHQLSYNDGSSDSRLEVLEYSFMDISRLTIPICSGFETRYFVTQEPLAQGTNGAKSDICFLFWQMVVEKNVKIIVMLKKKAKSEYFPSSVHGSSAKIKFIINNREVSIECKSILVRKNVTVRTLKIECESNGKNTEHSVTHITFHTLSTKQSFDDNCDNFLELFETFYKYEAGLDGDHPVLVHSKSGKEHTGMFIGIDILLRRILASTRWQDQPTSLIDILKEIRENARAMHMQPDEEELLTIYNVLKYFSSEKSQMYEIFSDIEQIVLKGKQHALKSDKPLCKNGTPSRSIAEKTAFVKLFRQDLHQLCERLRKNDEIKDGVYGDFECQKFRQISEQNDPSTASTNESVNQELLWSVFLPVYPAIQAKYLVTKEPLGGNYDGQFNFWQMVMNQNVKMIVMMQKEAKSQYFPLTCHDEPLCLRVTCNMYVECESVLKKKNVTVRCLKIECDANGKNSEHSVTHITFDTLSTRQSFGDNCDNFFELFETFYEYEARLDGDHPVLVHSKNGKEHTGMFIGIDILLRRILAATRWQDQPTSLIGLLKELRPEKHILLLPDEFEIVTIYRVLEHLSEENSQFYELVSYIEQIVQRSRLFRGMKDFCKNLIVTGEFGLISGEIRYLLAKENGYKFDGLNPAIHLYKRNSQGTLINLASSNVLIDETFKTIEKIPSESRKQVMTIRTEDQAKNRFRDILPYENTNVKLTNVAYINASYVCPTFNKNNSSHATSGRYITCQGPLENTSFDFWMMVLQKRVRLIVMLTKTKEEGKDKCAQYFPENSYDSKEFIQGNQQGYKIVVQCWNLEEYTADNLIIYQVRKLKVTYCVNEQNRTSVELTHCNFLAWPDHSTPELPHYNAFFIKYIELKMELMQKANASPIVVHCSAGVGRTGTHIALDLIYEKLMLSQPKYHIKSLKVLIERLRMDRMLLVQSDVQYLFIIKQILCSMYQPGWMSDLLAFYNKIVVATKVAARSAASQSLTSNTASGANVAQSELALNSVPNSSNASTKHLTLI